MRDFIKKYEVWVFLILAPIANGIFVYGIDANIIPGRLYLRGRFFLLLFLLVSIIWYTQGKEGIKDIFKPMLNWKIPLKWWFFAFIFASSIACITLLLKALYLNNDFTVFEISFKHVTDPLFMFYTILFAFVGEVVWVSYAVRKLSKILNLFYASQITGLVWGIWWFPIVWFNMGVIPDLPLLPLIINMMGAAGMCAFVYAKTKSGLVVWLLQLMLNTSGVLFPVTPTFGGIPTYTAFSLIYFIIMLAFMLSLKSSKQSLKFQHNISTI